MCPERFSFLSGRAARLPKAAAGLLPPARLLLWAAGLVVKRLRVEFPSPPKGPTMKRLIVLAALPLLALPLRAADLPADLGAVPGDAIAFVHVRVAEMWKGDGMKEVRALVKKAGPDALRSFDQRFLPTPSSIDRVTLVVFPPAGGRQPEVLVVIAPSAAV